MINTFFKNKGPFNILRLLELSSIDNKINFGKNKITDIKDLINATKNDITFFHSRKYDFLASKTKASLRFFLTTRYTSTLE